MPRIDNFVQVPNMIRRHSCRLTANHDYLRSVLQLGFCVQKGGLIFKNRRFNIDTAVQKQVNRLDFSLEDKLMNLIAGVATVLRYEVIIGDVTDYFTLPCQRVQCTQ